MCKVLDYYNKWEKEICIGKKNVKTTNNEFVELPVDQMQMLDSLFYSKNGCISEKIKKNLIKDILKKPNQDNGKVYEALIYYWLEKYNINYKPQVHIEPEGCFKLSNKGYEADGKIEENNVIFDVKQFGITLPHIERLRRKLQSMIPENYYLIISGGKNISTKELQSNFLEKPNELLKSIMNEGNKTSTDFIYQDSKYGLEFHIYDNTKSRKIFSISEFDPYEWAENNQFYFIYHASQFCVNSPYILFCPYDKKLMPDFFRNDQRLLFLSFRTLCRRIFMNLTKMKEKMIDEFDGKAQKNISVSTATKKISAIVFIDVSEDFDYKKFKLFVFQNPNADYKIPRYQINNIFRNVGAHIDTFEHDNY